MRPLCKSCNRQPRAINGYHNGKLYYRTQCSACIRRNLRLPQQTPRWSLAGYKKKRSCDVCGFRARYPAQLTVWHSNGNLNDCSVQNLKTVCLNCAVELVKSDSIWRRGDLEEDR